LITSSNINGKMPLIPIKFYYTTASMIQSKAENVIIQPDYCLLVAILTVYISKGTIKFNKIHRKV